MPQNIHCKLPQHLAQLAVASITAESYRSLKISKASNLSARGKKASVFLHIDVEKQKISFMFHVTMLMQKRNDCINFKSLPIVLSTAN